MLHNSMFFKYNFHQKRKQKFIILSKSKIEILNFLHKIYIIYLILLPFIILLHLFNLFYFQREYIFLILFRIYSR